MEYDLYHEKKFDTAICQLRGDLGLNDVEELVPAILKYCREKDLFRIIFDLRKALLRIDLEDLIYLSMRTEDLGMGSDFREALLVSDKEFKFQFYEQLTSSKGKRLKLFTDRGSALQWITDGE